MTEPTMNERTKFLLSLSEEQIQRLVTMGFNLETADEETLRLFATKNDIELQADYEASMASLTPQQRAEFEASVEKGLDAAFPKGPKK